MKVLFCQNVTREKLREALSHEKHPCKTLMKLTPVVNFVNVLRTAFVLVDPKSVKIQLSHQCLFTLLGSTSLKAVCRTLM